MAQQVGPLGEQGAVGGEIHLKAQSGGQVQQPGQLGVEQGFPHEMEVEIFRVGPQLLGQNRKVLRGQKALGAACAGAEIAAQIAHVGDLQIDLFQLIHGAGSFG